MRVDFFCGVFITIWSWLEKWWRQWHSSVLLTFDFFPLREDSLACAIRRNSCSLSPCTQAIAREALLDDGLFDYVRVGRIPRLELIRYIPGMITGNLPVGHPQLALGRCRGVRITSQEPLPIHLDGEVLARPEDGIRELEIQILPARLIVQGLVALGSSVGTRS
jgi:diacylglycerol kinase family enzyme